MWKAVWILAVWRLTYLVLQKENQSVSAFNATIVRGFVFLFLCYLLFEIAGIFVYLTGAYITALVGALPHIMQVKSRDEIRTNYLLHGLAALFLVPTVIHSYVVFSHQDTLDRLRYYAYPGTAPSRLMAGQIEKEGLDYDRVREMIESPRRSESRMAFEILYVRRTSDDLLALEETVLEIPESEYQGNTVPRSRFDPWLSHWLYSLTGKDISTHDDLKSWIDGEKQRRADLVLSASGLQGIGDTSSEYGSPEEAAER